MNFTFTEEQLLIRDAANRYFRDEYDLDTRRAHQAEPVGFSCETWAQFADMGWLAVGIPEDQGGIGGGAVEMAILMEAMGHGLAVEPYISSVVLGGDLLRDGAKGELAGELLPRLAAGELLLSFAYAEAKSRYELNHVTCTAHRDGGGYVLNGHKVVALHGASAEMIVVSARTGGGDRDAEGVTIFIVDAQTSGMTIRGYPTVDGLCAANIQLENVVVPAEYMLGELDVGLPLIERTIDRATTMIAAEAVGIMSALTDQTVQYLKDRKQFGKSLGDFQALQHRVTEMYMETELTRSLAYMAAVQADSDNTALLAKAASQAKVKVGRAGRMIGQEAVQLHGGMGITEEMPVGHYFKRLTMIDHTFGDAMHHLERLVRLPGLGSEL